VPTDTIPTADCRIDPTTTLGVASQHAPAGLTVADVARRYRVGGDKVRRWIRRGELAAINTAAVLCARPRWVITPDALTAFEKRRAGGPRRSRRSQESGYRWTITHKRPRLPGGSHGANSAATPATSG
jgi:hypothetical protein